MPRKSASIEPVALDHGPHRAVEHENAAGEQFAEKRFFLVHRDSRINVRSNRAAEQETKKPHERDYAVGPIKIQRMLIRGDLAFFNLVASDPKSLQVDRLYSDRGPSSNMAGPDGRRS